MLFTDLHQSHCWARLPRRTRLLTTGWVRPPLYRLCWPPCTCEKKQAFKKVGWTCPPVCCLLSCACGGPTNLKPRRVYIGVTNLPAKRTEPIEEVENESDDVNRHHNQNPQCVAEGLKERHQRGVPRLLWDGEGREGQRFSCVENERERKGVMWNEQKPIKKDNGEDDT